MEDQEIIDKINKASNGDWKRENFIKNCVGYVIDNFDEIEPIIKKHWLDKEKKKIEVKIDGIPTQDYGTSNSQTCYNKSYTDKER